MEMVGMEFMMQVDIIIKVKYDYEELEEYFVNYKEVFYCGDEGDVMKWFY